MNRDELIAKGKQVVESGRYAPKRGELLGRLELWGVDVYEGSPQEWKTALAREIADREHDR
ncbi:MAG TPA: hypothetical protein VKA77_08635 [Mycobacterium sp.]|nr:hypothetical protein [Mycobacterium sp.]